MPNILPVALNFDTPTTTTADLAVATYSKGGVVGRVNKGINTLSDSLTVNITTANYQVLEDFLKANEGLLIKIGVMNDKTVSDGKLYKYTSFSIKYDGPNVRSYSFELKQKYRP
jgi:hypothetical protein